MKKANLFFTLLMIIVLFSNCQKEENTKPTCAILTPSDSATFFIGDTIKITSEAADEDGTIKEMKLTVNGEGKTFTSNNTLDYNLLTDNYSSGNYTIAIIAIDNENAETTTQISVELIEKTEVPSLTITSIDSITNSSVKVNCQILNNGNSTLTESGVCWNTEAAPTIDGHHNISAGISDFYKINIQDLETNTTYYLRAYAKNNVGIAYSELVSFTTLEDFETVQTGQMTDTRDNKVYSTVRIANIWWLAQNLDFYTESSVYYQNDSLTYSHLGRLYSYEDALYSCPTGWHLASDDEWISLERAMGLAEGELSQEGWRGTGIATKLKVGGESKFEATVGGYAHDGNFADLGLGYWWTSSKKESDKMWFRSISDYLDTVERNAYPDDYKFSARCVKDE